MMPFLGEVWGNPSSIHQIGRRARALLDDARDRMSRALHCRPSEVVFTSGGTESNNLAILGCARALRKKGNHLITSSVEHHAVLHTCQYLERHENFRVTYLPVDRSGAVDPNRVAGAISDSTILVSIMAANNEIGTIQPVSEIGRICQERGILFHTDAVQWFGKEPVLDIHQFNADLVSICGHKFHGPKGAGALYIRSPLHPDPILFGGGHENERRAGTENLAGIAGLVKATEKFATSYPVFVAAQLSPLVKTISECLRSLGGVHLVENESHRLNNTIAFCVEGSDSIALLAGLDMEDICASSGSACSAGSLEPSHVIRALGWGEPLANALVRFSLGRDNNADQIQRVIERLPRVIRRAQLGQ